MRGLIPKDEYIDVIAATTGALKDESLRNRFIALGFEYITLRVEHDRATTPRAEVDVDAVCKAVYPVWCATTPRESWSDMEFILRRALARATGGV